MVAPWYERLIDFFFIDLIEIFCEIGRYLFIAPVDLIPDNVILPEIILFGINLGETPLIGYISAYVVYLFIAIRIVRLVVGG